MSLALASRTPRGFSLVELVVAIGIVALLVAILLPTARHARNVALTTKCLSNTRQMGVLLNVYLVDSNGVLPTLNNRGSTAEPGPAMDTLLVPESGDTGLYHCPADDASLYETTGSSYFWNFTVNGQRIDDIFSIVGGDAASRVPIVSDKEGFHPELRDKIVVLYTDGHAERALIFSILEDSPELSD